MKFQWNKKRLAGFGAAAAAAAATLFVVLPALASNPGDLVPGASGHNVTPTNVGYGGNGECSKLFPKLWATGGVTEYDNPNPQTLSNLPSGHNDGVKFDLKLGGTNQAQTLNVTGHGAAILAIGIKGGNDTTAYDYYGKDFPADGGTGWVSGDTNLHAPASKFQVNTNTTPPTETTITQYYGVSLLNVCYRALVTVSGEAFKDVGGDGSISVGDTGIDGLTATLKDTTTGQTSPSQLTKNGGLYSFGVPAGDSYQVCITSPTAFGNVQTAPTSTTTSPLNSVSCSGTGQAGWGYTGSGAQSALRFGFEPYGSISGLVYQEKSQPTDDSFDGNDAVLSGWTVTLYDGATATQNTTSDANGNYSFSVLFNTTHTYTVCETPPSGNWGQSEPSAPAASPPICGTTAHPLAAGELAKGHTLTPSSTTQVILAQDFGNVGGQACTPDAPFGEAGYQIQLETCKQHNAFMFDTGTLPGGGPYVSVWASGPDTTPTPMVEQITFTDPISGGQPAFTGLNYDDTFPFLGPYTPMPECLGDPRPAGSGFSLVGNATPDAVLPAHATSCVISTTITATTATTATFVAYVYSDIDGLRTSN